jgi:prefoldin subunit 5
MPRVMGNLASEYVEKQKKMTKIEKLEKEIENYQTRINEYQNRIDELTPMSKEELIVELGNHPMLGWRVKNDYKWENIDKTHYKGTKEDWEAEQQKLVEEGVVEMLNWDVERPKRYIKDYQKKIVKLQAKLQTLK